MHQQSLFENPDVPKAIQIFPEFISQAEEIELLELFKTIPWQSIHMHGVTAKRRVAHYGLDYTYTKRSVQKTKPAPPWLSELTARVAKILDMSAKDIKEILVTSYPAGSGIGWHKDSEVFGDAIVGVSFLSDCTMKFKDPETARVHKIMIPRRSAYVFSGEARWKWLHSITSHREERISITFRTLAADAPS